MILDEYHSESLKFVKYIQVQDLSELLTTSNGPNFFFSFIFLFYLTCFTDSANFRVNRSIQLPRSEGGG